MSIEIGRGKLVGYQGPGSLYIDTDGSSYIISAADKWYNPAGINRNIDVNLLKISDKRLESILGVYTFYEVPQFRKTREKDRFANTYLQIPISRFPLVEYCAECHTLRRAKGTFTNKKRFCNQCGKNVNHIQFPIVIICEEGHISDFPFESYTHVGGNYKKFDEYKDHRVYIKTRNSPSILNWSLKCATCGASHSLSGVTGRGNDHYSPFQNEMRGAKCLGRKPWTGDNEKDECESNPIAILKNNLNVYQPELVQTLSLTNEHNVSSHPTLDEILSQEFTELAENIETSDLEKLKVEESFQCVKENTIIKRVNKVIKLQELIVQTNFHRVQPSDDDISFTNATKIRPEDSMLFSKEVQGKWYPAKRMYGEGIFIEFNTDVLKQWEEKREVKKRFEKVQLRTEDFYLANRFPSASSILIHTISHALIREFSKYSGYPITYINEKLYLNIDETKNGLLIYVTDSDKAGTFGGLVRLAEEKKFKEIFHKALNNMDWCGSDPVCYEFGETNGQGLENSNGSACHNCVYVPDISCGFRNCFLDRDYASRSNSEVVISKYFNWFDIEHIQIIELGQEIYGEYKDWDEFSIEQSNVYKDKDWRLPDFYDGIVIVDGENYEVKYIWEKEKRIVLYNDQPIPDNILGEKFGWEIYIES